MEVKQRIYPMLGFKKFVNALVTLSGIELVQQIRKGQFDTTKLTGRVGEGVPPVWGAVLNA
jgi:transposase-like protein